MKLSRFPMIIALAAAFLQPSLGAARQDRQTDHLAGASPNVQRLALLAESRNLSDSDAEEMLSHLELTERKELIDLLLQKAREDKERLSELRKEIKEGQRRRGYIGWATAGSAVATIVNFFAVGAASKFPSVAMKFGKGMGLTFAATLVGTFYYLGHENEVMLNREEAKELQASIERGIKFLETASTNIERRIQLGE